MPRRARPPLAAGFSCLVLVASVALFSHWMLRFGRVPVSRYTEPLSVLTSFLEFWTTAFFASGLVSLALSVVALRASRTRRPLAWVALAGSTLWLALLFGLRATS
jgi:hypothetical protein